MSKEWERVANSLERIRIPEGWLYRSITAGGVGMVFVPRPVDDDVIGSSPLDPDEDPDPTIEKPESLNS